MNTNDDNAMAPVDSRANAGSPYARFASDNLILRDELAIDRTLLANERTLLAYLRSAIALIIAGVSIIHFVNHGWFLYVGIGCIPVGVATGIVGVIRYQRMNKSIGSVRRAMKTTSSFPPPP